LDVRPLDEELLSFIGASVPSVWALELLLLLRRRQDRTWTAQDLVGEMRASAPAVNDSLRTLEKAGLIRCGGEGQCAYAPASPVLDAICDQLEAAYKERPVAVVNAILKAPKGTLQTFADAFRIKGKGDPE